MKRIDLFINCAGCKKPFKVTPALIRQGRKNCSLSCKQKYVWSLPEYREMQSKAHAGGNPISTMKLVAFVKNPKNKSLLKGSSGKRWEGKKGSLNHRWIGDRSNLKKYGDDYKDRASSASQYWSRCVKNRDGWKCKIANGDCSGRMESHHILNWIDYPELRYEIKNGITLCHAHHPKNRKAEMELSPYFQSIVNTYAE